MGRASCAPYSRTGRAYPAAWHDRPPSGESAVSAADRRRRGSCMPSANASTRPRPGHETRERLAREVRLAVLIRCHATTRMVMSSSLHVQAARSTSLFRCTLAAPPDMPMSHMRSLTQHSHRPGVSAGGGCNKTRVRAYVTHTAVCSTFLRPRTGPPHRRSLLGGHVPRCQGPTARPSPGANDGAAAASRSLAAPMTSSYRPVRE
jgi:hypothetical protein